MTVQDNFQEDLSWFMVPRESWLSMVEERDMVVGGGGECQSRKLRDRLSNDKHKAEGMNEREGEGGLEPLKHYSSSDVLPPARLHHPGLPKTPPT